MTKDLNNSYENSDNEEKCFCDELISLMDPNYTSQTQREFDVSKIIEKNDALKIKTVKPKPYELNAGRAPISSELIEMAKTILASGNLSYGR
jgi:hypothetical protein